MPDQIKPGDLVMIIKPTPCCGHAPRLGYIFTVAEISSGLCHCLNCHCLNCHSVFISSTWAKEAQGDGGMLMSTRKKINPPADDESRETIRELEAV